jgi:hypothetical protein
LGEHFHGLRQSFVPLGQSVDAFVGCHAFNSYVAPRIVKNYGRRSFNGLVRYV